MRVNRRGQSLQTSVLKELTDITHPQRQRLSRAMRRLLLAKSRGFLRMRERGHSQIFLPCDPALPQYAAWDTVRPGRLDEGDRGATGFRRHSAPDRPTTQKEHDEQGEFFLSNTVLLTTSLHTAPWLRPDIYLGMSAFPSEFFEHTGKT